MMKTLLARYVRITALACAGTWLTAAAQAQLAYRVSMDTRALIGHPAGAFLLDFQLNDGEGFGNGNNRATLTNFEFGGGQASGAGTAWGGAGGDLWTGVTIVDTEAFNEFYQEFQAGGRLTFDLHLTANLNDGLVPDLFSFALLDRMVSNLPTLSGGSDALLEINIDYGVPAIAVFGSDVSIEPNAGGPGLALGAPNLRPIPEPSTYGLIAAGLLAGVAWWRRRGAVRR